MNNSGESLRKIDDLHDEDTRLIVVHDDIDLPIGEMRISVSRGAGGHNGVSSIIEHYGSKHFIRIRIGIAPTTFFGAIKKPRGEVAVQKYVLSKFSSREGKIISNVVIKAVDAISIIQEQGAEKAMNTFN